VWFGWLRGKRKEEKRKQRSGSESLVGNFGAAFGKSEGKARPLFQHVVMLCWIIFVWIQSECLRCGNMVHGCAWMIKSDWMSWNLDTACETQHLKGLGNYRIAESEVWTSELFCHLLTCVHQNIKGGFSLSPRSPSFLPLNTFSKAFRKHQKTSLITNMIIILFPVTKCIVWFNSVFIIYLLLFWKFFFFFFFWLFFAVCFWKGLL